MTDMIVISHAQSFKPFKSFNSCQSATMNFLIGKKLNMTQHFTETGEVIPVTVILSTPMTVTQVKSADSKDKYNAVQVGTGKKGKVSKSIAGHTKDLGTFSVLTEFRVSDAGSYQRGQKLDLSGFQVGEVVNVVGISKGRGFAGAIKRHGFAGFPASHGHNKPRSVGSIGQRFPQHTRKGLRMAGHMGVENVTVKNLQVVEVDAKKNLLTLKGAIPGHRNGMIKVISTGKVKPLVKMEAVKEEKKKK
jgi:large subunit ribosomal protein L3